MASTNDVTFPESMADLLANPVDICFGSMPTTSTAPAACLVIYGNTVSTNQKIETDLSKKPHPPTPSDLIAGIDRVGDMISDIKICEHAKRPCMTPSTSSMPLGLRNAARVASHYMKRKIQIESGLCHQDLASCRNHLDEPCPIHENPKHTVCQSRVLKKFRRPLTTAHRRRLHQESSPACLVFQVAHTTMSPNYPGEEFETPDRQILVVSADVPPQDGETDAQHQERENANAAQAVRRQQEIAAAATAAGLPPANAEQVNANPEQQALVVPAAPQQRRHDDPPRANRLRARDLLRNFEHDGHEVYNSPQTNLGAALAVLNHLEDSPAIRRLQANVRVAAAQIEETGPGYSRSVASSYSRNRSERHRQRRQSQGPLDQVAEEGKGENEVMQLANPAANAAANAPANPTANAPANAPANAGNAANKAANAGNIQGNPAPNPRRNAGTQPPPIQPDRAEGSR
jgi:hypothetical protein